MKTAVTRNALNLLATVFVAAFALQLFSHNKADVDLWGNVGFVRCLPWSADYAVANTFSYSEPQHPWTNHEWGAEYILWKTFELGGNPALLLLKVAIGFSLLALMNAEMRRRMQSGAIRFFYLLLILSTIGYGFSTRPHLFTYIAIGTLYALLRRAETGRPRALFLTFPALAVLWTNLHGAFFIGIVVLLVYGLARLRKSAGGTPPKPGDRDAPRAGVLLLLVPIWLILSLLNPYGPSLWSFIAESAAIVRPYLSEWAAPHLLHDFYDHVDFLVLALITWPCVILTWRKRDPAWTALLTVSFFSALLMRRNIPIFALTAAYAAAPAVDDAVGARLTRIAERVHPNVQAFTLAVMAAVSLIFAAMFNKNNPMQIEIQPARFPAAVVRTLADERVEGNALVFFDWGELCIWHLHPRCRVFMDGRLRSAYSPETITAYLDFIYAGEKWEAALDDYATDIVLVHRGNPIVPRMARRQGWSLVYADGLCALFMKSSVHASVIPRLRERMKRLAAKEQVLYFP